MMLTLLDPVKTDPYAFGQGFINWMFSVSGTKDMGWNYILDYSWVAQQIDALDLDESYQVLDIGCGPGMLHVFLEYKHGINIIGIDEHEWPKAKNQVVDVVGDFCDPLTREKSEVVFNSVDLIISLSAFEHNDFKKHKEIVDMCMCCLKGGGVLLSTVSTNPWSTQSEKQWNLSQEELEDIYKSKFNSYDYYKVRENWRKHSYLKDAYKQRYRKWDVDSPHFLTIGAKMIKQ